MPEFPFRLVTIDIDGTLTTVHGWRFLAERVGRRVEFERSNQRFFSRATGEDEHLRELLGLATGLSREELERILVATPKVAGIAETVEELHRRGCRVALLTHNPEYVTGWYAQRFGFDDAEGTPATGFEEGRIGPPGPLHADKLGGLARLLARTGVSGRETAHVGDGWADALVFPRVGAGVALNSDLPEVERAADAALHADDLRALLPVLARLLPRGASGSPHRY